MRGLDLLPFADEHLDEAAELLARRHSRQRAVEPLLSPAFEQPRAARAELEAAWQADGASGATAIRDGRLVGFMVGAPRTSPLWGPNVFVETAGHAAEEAETVRDLYGLAAARWVDEGRTSHYVLAPATDPSLLEAWSRLGFGQQQGLGIQEVPTRPGEAGRVEVRDSVPDDVDDLIALDLLGEHQSGSPVFSAHTRPPEDELRADILEEIADPEAAMLIAHLDGRAVGCATVAPVSYSSLHGGLARPDDACILGYAATLPEVRGHGAGLALTEGVFAWARDRGYRIIVVDWRTTNLLASRFWPARGFRTSFLRLHRSLT